MREIEVVYSPLCEQSGAMLGKLKQWLKKTDVEILVYPFSDCPQKLKEAFSPDENCFVDVFYSGVRIDSVPLHKAHIFNALNIPLSVEQATPETEPCQDEVTDTQLLRAFESREISFHPIMRDNYLEEMSMCLCHYPFGNPPKEFHENCIAIKSKVFEEVWTMEDIAGIYAKYRGTVIGLLEVMPREILKKYGYMTGSKGNDDEYVTVGCFEVARCIPRIQMIDLLMNQLGRFFPKFHRSYIEGIGIYGWNDGFNPYWVYLKYGFEETEALSENTVVMEKKLHMN